MILKKLTRFVCRECRYFLWAFAAYFPMLPTFMLHYVRPFIWKLIGIKIGKNVKIGFGVYLDVDGYNRIEIEDDAIITAQVLLLTHRREMKAYTQGLLQRKLPYIQVPIKIGKNASIGMRAIILPGVTIGEGAVVGAGSLVTKDIPPYCIAAGVPAKIIKEIK